MASDLALVCLLMSLLKIDYSMREEFALSESKFFPYREVDKIILTELLPLKVYLFHFNLHTLIIVHATSKKEFNLYLK